MTIEKLATGSALLLHLNIGVFSDADKLVSVREFATCFRLKKHNNRYNAKY
jgi:hypothetical protein